MKITRVLLAILAAGMLGATVAQAANLAISIGIRETGGNGPAFSNAGAGGGIEWVNLDGQSLAVDGTWQQFTFTPSTDTLSAFAGASADGNLDVDWASLEHIRIRNVDGITLPITLWVDDVNNTDAAAGSTTEGFEGNAVGDEVIFQEPSFSGSTAGNLVVGSTAGVTDSMAFSGAQSYQADFQFIDATDTRWLRFTTFSSANIPNPAMHVREAGAAAPTISFWAKAVAVPEPAALALFAIAGVSLAARRRR